jgi:E3 ubiquitin-protein ligase MARCH6
MKEWALIAGKASVAVILLMGLIPFLFGVLLDLVVLTPVRVPLHQSPIYFLWQVVAHLKIVKSGCTVYMIGTGTVQSELRIRDPSIR